MKYVIAALLLLPTLAFGQSVPNPSSPIGPRVVWTWPQWVVAWQSKADASAGVLTNPTMIGTVSGTGITALFASPPCIGCTTPAAGHFTTLGATGTATLLSGTGRDLTVSDGTTYAKILVANGNPLVSQSHMKISSVNTPQGTAEFTILGYGGNNVPLSGTQTYKMLDASVGMTGASTADQHYTSLSVVDGLNTTGSPNGSFTLSVTNAVYGNGTHSALLAQVNVSASGLTGGGTYVAADGWFQANQNVGGASGGLVNAKGLGYGMNPQCVLLSGATYWYSCDGGEVDVAAAAGSSVYRLTGWAIILTSGHASHGILGQDSALDIGTQAGITTEWDQGIRIGDTAGPFPVSGALFQAFACGASCGSIPNTAITGFDISQITFTGNTWNDGHVVLSGNGSANLNATTALALSATAGFVGLPFTAGIPSGSPTLNTNCAIDTTNGYLNCYYGAAWHKIAFSAGAG